MKIKVTMNLSREPGGKERSYTFEKGSVVYIKRGYYSNVKKNLLRIHFNKGCGMPDFAFSPLSMDDIEEILNSSPVLMMKDPQGFIRIPVSPDRNGKQQEQLIDLSAITGIQVCKLSAKDRIYIKIYLKDKENHESVLYTNTSGDEMDMILRRAAENAN